MATKKAAKKVIKKEQSLPSKPRPKKPAAEYNETFSMPVSVANWIEYAESTLRYQKTQIADLKQKVAELQAYKKWAEQRILRSDHE